jgi:hypothetical protein
MKKILTISAIIFSGSVAGAVDADVDECIERLSEYKTAKISEAKAQRKYDSAAAGYKAARGAIAGWIRDEFNEATNAQTSNLRASASKWKKILSSPITGKCSGNSDGSGIVCSTVEFPYTKGTSANKPECNADSNSEQLKGQCKSDNNDPGCSSSDINKSDCEAKKAFTGNCLDNTDNTDAKCTPGNNNKVYCGQLKDSSDNSCNFLITEACKWTVDADGGCTRSFIDSQCCQPTHKKSFQIYENNFLALESDLTNAKIVTAAAKKKLWPCPAVEATLDSEIHIHAHTHDDDESS